MNPGRRLNQYIHAEIDELVKSGILDETQAGSLKMRYAVTAWDPLRLVRHLTILGVLVMAAGLFMILGTHLEAMVEVLQMVFGRLIRWLGTWVDWWLVLELLLVILAVVCLLAGHRLRRRSKLEYVGLCVQLFGAFLLQGATTVMATRRLDGDNWPLLVGAQSAMMLGIAYVALNRLVLWYGCALFFFWFGAQTGYIAGWGCYWLGMTYPVRYLLVGAGSLLLAWLHGVKIRGSWASFSRVYAHYGLLVINLAFWFLSLFGYYEDYDTPWSDIPGQRLTFSFLWAAFSSLCIYLGADKGIKLARAYGITFLIINLYTFYFQFVVAHTGAIWFLHLLLTGGSLVMLAIHLERHRS
jgi:hypothetical protein